MPTPENKHIIDIKDDASLKSTQLNIVFVLAWFICVIFYFIQYSMRSAPGIMLPEITQTLGIDRGEATSIIGLYFYSYAIAALISGAALDRIGPRFVVPTGIILLSVGAALFGAGYTATAAIGRLLQGAGSGVAFTGAIFLATRGFPKTWLATAVGVTQCIGMLGGSIGQAAVAPLIHTVINWQQFWFFACAILMIMAVAMLAVTPRVAVPEAVKSTSLLHPYKVVLTNPQSYLCGIVAGLLFMPTNIADMIWGVQFLESGLNVSYEQAVNRVSMIPLGWVIGCPLMGYISDYIGRRKPVILFGAVLMLIAGSAIVYLPPNSMPPYILGLIFGIASGAAMIPYTVVKEVNPDEVKGSATGAINFIVFGFTAFMTPVIGHQISRLAGGGPLSLDIFRQVDLIYVAGVILAIILTFFIKETGSKTKQ